MLMGEATQHSSVGGEFVRAERTETTAGRGGGQSAQEGKEGKRGFGELMFALLSRGVARIE